MNFLKVPGLFAVLLIAGCSSKSDSGSQFQTGLKTFVQEAAAMKNLVENGTSAEQRLEQAMKVQDSLARLTATDPSEEKTVANCKELANELVDYSRRVDHLSRINSLAKKGSTNTKLLALQEKNTSEMSAKRNTVDTLLQTVSTN